MTSLAGSFAERKRLSSWTWTISSDGSAMMRYWAHNSLFKSIPRIPRANEAPGDLKTSPSCRIDPCAIDHCHHTLLQEVHRKNQKAFAQLVLHQEAFHAFQRSARDADALAFTQVRIRREGELGIEHSLKRLDLHVRNRTEPVPPFTENANDASCLLDFDVRVLVDSLVEKQVPGEHRNLNHVPYSTAATPDADPRQKDIEPFGHQLVRHQLLGVTSSPDGIPVGVAID